jgi:multidrug resistance efflux pump
VSLSFDRSVRALATGPRTRRWMWALSALLFAAWLAWLIGAEVAVYAVSREARLEVSAGAHAVEAPVDGRVEEVRVVLGQEVARGDILAILDVESLRLERGEAEQQIASLTRDIEALEQEIAALEAVRVAASAARDREIAEARAEHGGLAQQAQLATRTAERTDLLQTRGVAPASDVDQARSLAQQSSARLAAHAQRIERLASEKKRADLEQLAQIQRLQREVAQRQGQIERARLLVARIEHDVDLRHVRAPVAGRIGEIATLAKGTMVAAGERVATVVPPGQLGVVALFAPGDAVGRIRPGQRARLRLDGYPWTQYGGLAAVVASVGNEVRDGLVRVELRLADGPRTAIPMQHGLTGTLDIEVETVSPLALILRYAGKRLTATP